MAPPRPEPSDRGRGAQKGAQKADAADLQLSRRKARDRSLTLVIAGIALLMPPMIGASLIDDTILGIPVPIFYVFAVWALLVAGAVALARPLRDGQSDNAAADYRDGAD